MRSALFLLAVLAGTSGIARAQPAAPPLTGFDFTASIGAFSADRSETPRDSSWSGSFFKGVSAGYYWTDHLKTEVELGFPNPTEGYSYSNQRLANGSVASTYDERTYSGPKFAVAQVYQFGRNAPFHPYAFAGVDIDREHIDLERHTFISGPRPLETEEASSSNRVRARGFTGAGFKAYVSERAFFKGEMKLDIGQSLNQVTWKAGVGVDLTMPRRVDRSGDAEGPAEAGHYVRSGAVPSPRGRDPVEVWRAYATLLPVGSIVDLAAASEHSVTAELLDVDDSGVLVKPKTRVAEPTRRIPFDRLELLRLHTGPSSSERAGAVAAGVGTGAGVFLGVLMMLIASFGG
jgi:hypothetical protein